MRLGNSPWLPFTFLCEGAIWKGCSQQRSKYDTGRKRYVRQADNMAEISQHKITYGIGIASHWRSRCKISPYGKTLNLSVGGSATPDTNHVLRGEKSVICLQVACETRVHSRCMEAEGLLAGQGRAHPNNAVLHPIGRTGGHCTYPFKDWLWR